MTYQTITCSEAGVTFDGPWTEADDYDNTSLIYEFFVSVVGG